MPRTPKVLEAAEQQVGSDRPRAMKSTGPAEDSLEPAYIEPAGGPVDPEWAANMAFMEEPVKVVVHESNDKNAEKIVEVFCNGTPQRFIRGVEQVVKRKYVGVLAQAKTTSYTQEKYKDDEGADAIKNIPHTALRYPFAVLEDTPKGKDWLKGVLAAG